MGVRPRLDATIPGVPQMERPGRMPGRSKESDMKTFRIVLALLAVASLAGFAFAGDEAQSVTVTGKIVCAKCTLQKADAKECQNVIVAEVDGATKEYYLAKNDVAEKYGHVCKGEKGVVATGTLSEADGRTWITASKMEQPKG